jgi:hypothetical protein
MRTAHPVRDVHGSLGDRPRVARVRDASVVFDLRLTGSSLDQVHPKGTEVTSVPRSATQHSSHRRIAGTKALDVALLPQKVSIAPYDTFDTDENSSHK